jgi:hypothetical protein
MARCEKLDDGCATTVEDIEAGWTLGHGRLAHVGRVSGVSGSLADFAVSDALRLVMRAV